MCALRDLSQPISTPLGHTWQTIFPLSLILAIEWWKFNTTFSVVSFSVFKMYFDRSSVGCLGYKILGLAGGAVGILKTFECFLGFALALRLIFDLKNPLSSLGLVLI